MNGVHPSQELLQRLHDRDLSAQEAEGLRSHLDACQQCQMELASLDRLGGLLRLSAKADLLGYGADAEPDFTRMFAEIQKAVAEPAQNTAPVGQVVPLRPVASPRKGGGSSRWLQRGAPALGAFALAAAALLMVFRSDNLPSSGDAGQVGDHPEAMAAVSRAEIVKVEFGANAGQVFDIPFSDGSSTPVVWIDDDDDEEE